MFSFQFFPRLYLLSAFLSHLILIVFPLIVFTYTVMLVFSGSSSSSSSVVVFTFISVVNAKM